MCAFKIIIIIIDAANLIVYANCKIIFNLNGIIDVIKLITVTFYDDDVGRVFF